MQLYTRAILPPNQTDQESAMFLSGVTNYPYSPIIGIDSDKGANRSGPGPECLDLPEHVTVLLPAGELPESSGEGLTLP